MVCDPFRVGASRESPLPGGVAPGYNLLPFQGNERERALVR